jgi:tetratricopeptide (TPR) repeat protein
MASKGFGQTPKKIGNSSKQSPKLQESLARAVLCQREGRLQEAEATYRQVVALDPDLFEAQYYLGCLLLVQGRVSESELPLRRAVALRPRSAPVHCDLGMALMLQGDNERLVEAEAYFRHATTLDPELPEAHNGLGTLLFEKRLLAEAQACFRQVLATKPDYVEAYVNLGNVLLEQVKLRLAVETQVKLRLVVETLEEAQASYQQALVLYPDLADALVGFGGVLVEQANLHGNRQKLLEAEETLRRALERQPTHRAEAISRLGAILREQGRSEEAQHCLKQALALRPDNADAHHLLASLLLLSGNYWAGWREYEWRWATHTMTPRTFEQPLWDGSDLRGRTLLVWAEQGHGDAIQFVRYVALLKAKGARVLLECRSAERRLFATCAGIDQLLVEGESIPPFDTHVPLMSLPLLLNTQLETIPSGVPYLSAPTECQLPEALQRRLEEAPGLKVGLVWVSKLVLISDYKRQIPPEALAPLFALSGISWFSLYKGEQVYDLEAYPQIVDLGSNFGDFADTAWAIDRLDIVISVDTSVAHLAGALGKPVWILLPYAADWRWLLERSDSPWYPTALLFRQPWSGDWQAVVAQIANALRELLDGEEPEAKPSEPESIRPAPQVEALLQRGIACQQTGRMPEAEAIYQQLLKLAPEHIQGLNLLGMLLCQQGRFEEAEPVLQRVVGLEPSAAVYNNLGGIRASLGDLLGAEEYFRQALTFDAQTPEAHRNLGDTQLKQRKLAEAEASFHRALDLRPDYVEAIGGIGCVWLELGRLHQSRKHLQEAEAWLRRALALQPRLGTLHYNLGSILLEQGQLMGAASCLHQAIQLQNMADAHFEHACLRLLQGDFARGWIEYEGRWQSSGMLGGFRYGDRPVWDGSDLRGKTLLMWAEQGHGDAIQFVRYVALLKAKGAQVLLECRSAERRLFATCAGIDLLVARDEPLPPFDAHAPLMSLPLLLNTQLETIPTGVPYLSAPAKCQLPEGLQRQLKEAPGLKIGLVWASKLGFTVDYKRYCPLEELAPLFKIPALSWFSLYKGDQNQQLRAHPQIVDLGSHCADFADTAWAIDQLDLVISVDTAVAHLAGAMGKLVWVLLPFVPDWRWLLEREDSPWYPTARLFRQPAFGEWQTVIERLDKALKQQLSTHSTTAQMPSALRETKVRNPKTQRLIDQALRHEQEARTKEAEAAYREALTLSADDPDILCRLSSILLVRGNPVAAEPLLRRLNALQPDNLAVYQNLVAVLEAQGKQTEALECCRRGLVIDPCFLGLLNLLGALELARGELEMAELAHRQAIALRPDNDAAHNNLGNVLQQKGCYTEALECYQRAIECNPDSSDARSNLGLLQLRLGDFEHGWLGYSWSLRTKTSTFSCIRHGDRPAWDGSDLRGKTLLVWAEQGHGDAIQFVRYVALLKAKGARVLLECRSAERRLFATCAGIDQLLVEGESIPPFDAHVPLMSLPLLMGTRLETIPAQIPYLNAPTECWLPKELQRCLQEASGFKVGLVWSASVLQYVDRKRRCPLALLAPLFEFPDISWFSLYKGEQMHELELYRECIVDLGSHLRDFADTAWVINQLDLVITVDTSVAHLAGAMGKPVWVLLPFVPDWRWLLEREDSSWYPTARLFRQSALGNWQSVAMALSPALQKLTATPTSEIPMHPLPIGSDVGNINESKIEVMLQVQRLLTLVKQFQSEDRLYEALEICEEALRIDPHSPDACNSLGMFHFELGDAQKAEILVLQAISLRPRDAYFHYNLALILNAQNRQQLAEACCLQAVALEPDFAEAYVLLGNVQVFQQRVIEAEVSYRRASDLRSDFSGSHSNLGNVLQEQGRYIEARECYERAIEQKPDLALAHNNLAYLLLIQGDYRAGLLEHEWRWQTGSMSPGSFDQRLWDGSDLRGKTLLVWAEQGHGDAIQFVRYVALLKAKGAIVIVKCRPIERKLFESCNGIDRLIVEGSSLPPFDIHVPMMSLPLLLGTEVETIPANIPYLCAPAECRLPEKLQQQVREALGLKIGLVWAPKLSLAIDRKRHCPLETLALLFEIPGVSWFSLYRGKQVVEMEPYRERIVDLGSHFGDFADTAWAINQLDLVITVDTSVAHLAGAMGKPVWVLLPFVPDWRWSLEREDSPWYPTARLFRQSALGDWQSVATALLHAFQEWLTGGAHLVTKHRRSGSTRHRPPLSTERSSKAKGFGRQLPQKSDERLGRAAAEQLLQMARQQQETGRMDEAEATYRQAIAQQPDWAIPHLLLGITLALGQRYAEAAATFRLLLLLEPNSVEAYNALGNVLVQQRQLDDAVTCYSKALAIRPDFAGTCYNLAITLHAQQRWQEAIDCYRQAISLQPGYSEAYLNLAQALLLAGDLKEGFAVYEWRWRVPGMNGGFLNCPQPVWDGTTLQGKTILLWAEQGYGETILCVRYASIIKTLGGYVLLRCKPELAGLLASCQGIDHIVREDEPLPPFDVHLPLISLPRVMNTTLESIQGDRPYLNAPEASLPSVLRHRLQQTRGIKIGLMWASNLNLLNDHNGHCPVELFEQLLAIEGTNFFSLYRGHRTAEFEPYWDRIVDLGSWCIHFQDIAWVVAQMDVVITVDTAVAHLAGALGKPVWILLPCVPDWCWLLEREDSPWYPTARLFRQVTPEDWQTPLLQVAQELRALIARSTNP